MSDRAHAPFDPSDEQITEAAFHAAMREVTRGDRRPMPLRIARVEVEDLTPSKHRPAWGRGDLGEGEG